MLYNGCYDTLCYNDFLDSLLVEKWEKPGLFGCYAFNHELGNMTNKRGKWYDRDGNLYVVAHFNGNSKNEIKERRKVCSASLK